MKTKVGAVLSFPVFFRGLKRQFEKVVLFRLDIYIKMR